jgi:hypothetical protein
MSAGPEIECKDLLKTKKHSAKEIVEAFNYLESRNLGHYFEIKNPAGPSKKVFRKANEERIKEIENIATLEFFGININNYISKLKDTLNKSKFLKF